MRLDLIRFYYISNNNPIGAFRKYKKENKLKENPCNPSYIVKLKQKFKKHILCMIYQGLEENQFFVNEYLRLKLLLMQHQWKLINVYKES